MGNLGKCYARRMWDCGSLKYQLAEKENRDFSGVLSCTHQHTSRFCLSLCALCCRMLYYKMASFSLDFSWICCYKMRTLFLISREVKRSQHEPGVRNQSWRQLNAAYWLALLRKPTCLGIYNGLGPAMSIINQKLTKKLQRHFVNWEFFSLNDSSLHQVDIKVTNITRL